MSQCCDSFKKQNVSLGDKSRSGSVPAAMTMSSYMEFSLNTELHCLSKIWKLRHQG